jgi:titin
MARLRAACGICGWGGSRPSREACQTLVGERPAREPEQRPSVIASATGSARIGGTAPPVAVNDSYAIAHDHTLTVTAATGVLANDTDPEEGTLTATLIAPAVHGTVTLDPSGSFTFVPAAGYFGSDRFTYQAKSGTLVSNIATVVLAVTNGAPVANGDAYTVAHDHSLTIAAPGVLLNDTDPAGVPLQAVAETVTT